VKSKEAHGPNLDSWTTRVVDAFLGSNFSVLLILICVGLGAVALIATPREEDPQIVVPFIDVFIEAPGASAQETQKLAAEPLERLLFEIPGVEHVYSMTRPGGSMVTVRFEVGEDREKALINVYNKIQSNLDRVPPQVSRWLVKPVEIDDVPILTLTLYSESDDGAQLVRYADEVAARLQTVDEVSRVDVVGGDRRVARVLLDPLQLRSRGLSALEVLRAIGGANQNARAGTLESPDGERVVEVGPFLRDVEDLESVVLTLVDGRPVFLRDVASVVDGPSEPQSYTRIAFGPSAAFVERGDATPSSMIDGAFRPAVTLSLAKRRGSNAVVVAERALERFDELARELLPERRALARHAQLRRDRRRKGQRARRPPAHRRRHDRRADRREPRLARSADRRAGGADHARGTLWSTDLSSATRSTASRCSR
jgi:multidrug efflux pump subunit AcrB